MEHRAETRHTVSDLPRCGRPRKISKEIVHDIEVLAKRGHVETLADMKSYVKEQHGLSYYSQCAAQGRVRTKSDEAKADLHCAHAGTAVEVGHIALP